MSSEYISLIVSTASLIISGLISYITAHFVANAELKKLRHSWTREDALSAHADFESLVSLIYRYVDSENPSWRFDAIEKLASIRTKETGELAAIYDALHDALYRQDKSGTIHLLSEVIKCKRKHHAAQKDHHRKKTQKQ